MTLDFHRTEKVQPGFARVRDLFVSRSQDTLCEQEKLHEEWLKNLRNKCHSGLQQRQKSLFVGIPDQLSDPEKYLEGISLGPGRTTFNLSSGRFIGHMTGGLPRFMEDVARLIVRLNQNMVKWETSGSFSFLEEQTLFMLHELVFRNPRHYYQDISDRYLSIGNFNSGGTLANLNALWVARDNAFPVAEDFDGAGVEGFPAALNHYGYAGAVVLVSERGHYSLKKSVNLLGLGSRYLIKVKTGSDGKICLSSLEKVISDCRKKRLKIVALTGIAGNTETGAVDPLQEMADLAKEARCHFHVDAAWGGATLVSESHRHLLKGIEHADSVTLDPHKQFYTPMGTGCVLFRSPEIPQVSRQTADYIIRQDSFDAGRFTVEGSRPNHSLFVHASLNILGKKGLSAIIDHGIGLAKTFATVIRSDPEFELTSEPELNILTYRYHPKHSRVSPEQLDKLNEEIQQEQIIKGLTFVSRTRIPVRQNPEQSMTVFRVVLANPLTTENDLRTVLEEQRALGESFLQQYGLHSLI